MLRRLVLVTSTFAAFGCTSTDAAPGAACVELAPTCLSSQRGCVDDDEGARCVACGAGQFPDEGGACTPIGGTLIEHDFGSRTLQPGEEIRDLCQIWTLDNDETLWVNAVELVTDGGYHHSNYYFVPEGFYDVPDGPWPNCYDHGFTELGAALAGGVLYGQSTQASQEVQKLGTGAAIRVPPHMRIVADTHLLNATGAELTTRLRLGLYTRDASEVRAKLHPFRLSYEDLVIAPRAVSKFEATCDFDTVHRSVVGGPLAMEMHYLLPHFHYLGKSFEVRIAGGPRDGELVFESPPYAPEAVGRALSPPVSLEGAKGLTFGCIFQNTSDREVRWGQSATDEMCMMLGFTASRLMVDATVAKSEDKGAGDDGVLHHGGPCGVLGVVAPEDD